MYLDHDMIDLSFNFKFCPLLYIYSRAALSNDKSMLLHVIPLENFQQGKKNAWTYAADKYIEEEIRKNTIKSQIYDTPKNIGRNFVLHIVRTVWN